MQASSNALAAPPKPNTRFSKKDMRRIKQQGPSVDDLYAHFEVRLDGQR